MKPNSTITTEDQTIIGPNLGIIKEEEEKQGIIDTSALDQSHLNSEYKNSQGISEIGNSILFSPQPQDIESIPKPQSGELLFTKAPMLPIFNKTETFEVFETPERAQSTYKKARMHRHQSSDLISYKEK